MQSVYAALLPLLFLAGCATDKLALAPPAGIDFSGHWSLNVADSDDPQHLLQAASVQSQAEKAATDGGSQSQGRSRGRGGSVPGYQPGSLGPPPPPAGAMGAGLRFPGREIEVKQVAGVVAFTSDGKTRVCQPSGSTSDARPHRKWKNRGRDDDDLPSAREAPPPKCGWDDKTLIVQNTDPDDDRPPFEEHYSLADGGERLIEVVQIKGGRSSGFTMSRVWDRKIAEQK